jgi:hypothetical protein
MNDRAMFSKASAADYLDMSVSTFDQTVRPFVARVEIETPGMKRPMLRWLKADLDAYVAARRKAA